MQYIKNIFFILTATFLLYSCEDFFETQVELPVSEHTPILAVNSFLNNNSSSIFVNVNRTFGLFEEIPINADRSVSNAKVEFFENNNLLFTIEPDELNPSNYFRDLPDNFLTAGNTYEMRVSHPDFATVSSVQTMPTAIPLIDATYREIDSNSFSGYDGEIEVTFNDPAGEENFYEFFAGRRVINECYDENGELTFSDIYFDQFSFDTEGPETPEATEDYGYQTLLIKDNAFDGQTHTFSAKFYDYGGFTGNICGENLTQVTSTKIVVFWRTISKDFYRYSTSLKQNAEAQDNPFAEPVSVFSNFDNGVGAFCLRSDLEYEIEE